MVIYTYNGEHRTFKINEVSLKKLRNEERFRGKTDFQITRIVFDKFVVLGKIKVDVEPKK